jgi:Ca2+/Na+ antiporter
MTENDLEGQTGTLEIVNAELVARLDRQFDSAAKIDNKAVVLLGYTVAASSFLATRHPELVLGVLAYTAYVVAAAFGVGAFGVGADQDVPDPRGLFDGYVERSKAQTLAALGAQRVIAFESNANKHARKAARWRISLAALVAGVALMVVSIIVHTGHYG